MRQKNQYKKEIMKMSYQEVLKEYEDVAKTKLLINSARSRNMNPAGQGQSKGFNIAMIHYKFSLLNQVLHNKFSHNK